MQDWIEFYDDWMRSPECARLMLQRWRKVQGRLDTGGWDSHEEYQVLADMAEELHAFLAEHADAAGLKAWDTAVVEQSYDESEDVAEVKAEETEDAEEVEEAEEAEEARADRATQPAEADDDDDKTPLPEETAEERAERFAAMENEQVEAEILEQETADWDDEEVFDQD